MWDDSEHWYWLGWGIALILFFFALYWAMIKSANYFRYRLYPPEQTVPILHEFSSTATKETETVEESTCGSKNTFGEERESIYP
jgi:hypothetical protein